MKKFRRVDKDVQILNKLIQVRNGNFNCSVWQMDKTGKRNIYSGKIFEVDINKKSIIFDSNDELKITNERSVYLTTESNNIAIKFLLAENKGKRCSLNIDSDMMCLELRAEDRKVYPFDQNIRCKIEKFEGYGSTIRSYDLRVLDYSTGGMCLNVNSQLLAKLTVGDSLLLLSLNGKDLAQPIEGQIVYHREFSLKTSINVIKSFRVGISFST